MTAQVVSGCLLFTTGDLEYYNNFLGQARWNANFPCPHCNVHLSNVENFRSVTDVSVDRWDSLPRQGQSCPLFHSLLTPLAICPDWMHTKHLGTDQGLLGSVAWVLLFEVDTEGPLELRLLNLLEELKETQFQHNNYLPFLFLSFHIFLYYLFGMKMPFSFLPVAIRGLLVSTQT